MMGIFKRSKLNITILAIAAAFALILTVVGVYAKYIKDVPVSGNITVSASLAEGFELYEHKAIRNEQTGAYTLGGEEVKSNSYTLIPGLDVPKDPTIRITNKSDIAAYLYVEVVSSLDGITFSMDDSWEKITVKDGREVYVYNSTSPNGEIPLIKGNTFTVTDQIKFKADQAITFHAYMAQAVGSKVDVFNSNF